MSYGSALSASDDQSSFFSLFLHALYARYFKIFESLIYLFYFDISGLLKNSLHNPLAPSNMIRLRSLAKVSRSVIYFSKKFSNSMHFETSAARLPYDRFAASCSNYDSSNFGYNRLNIQQNLLWYGERVYFHSVL